MLAEQVITDHDQITAMSAQAAEGRSCCWRFRHQSLVTYAPSSAPSRLLRNIDRMGALALHVAKIARRRHRHQLAWALQDRPELLTGAGAEAPIRSVLRLIDSLCAAGASAIAARWAGPQDRRSGGQRDQ